MHIGGKPIGAWCKPEDIQGLITALIRNQSDVCLCFHANIHKKLQVSLCFIESQLISFKLNLPKTNTLSYCHDVPLSRRCLTSSASKRSPVLLSKFKGRPGSGSGYSNSLSFTTSVVGHGTKNLKGEQEMHCCVNPITQLVHHQMQLVWISN